MHVSTQKVAIAILLVSAALWAADDPLMGKDAQPTKGPAYRVGISSMRGLYDSSTITERYLNPVIAGYHAVVDTGYLGYLTVVAMKKLVSGSLSQSWMPRQCAWTAQSWCDTRC